MSAAAQSECRAAHKTRGQLDRLNDLLAHTWECNPFYRTKWQRAGVPCQALESMGDLQMFPMTTRAELLSDQLADPPFGTNLAAPRSDFKRILHSSGTTRRPIFWADTPRCWNWVTQCSAALHEIITRHQLTQRRSRAGGLWRWADEAQGQRLEVLHDGREMQLIASA